jgi:hypothetical protein
VKPESGAPEFMAALSEVARLLEADDAPAAAEAMQALLQQLRPELRLPDQALAEAKAMLARCVAAEGRLRIRVVTELNSMGTARRAGAAYLP